MTVGIATPILVRPGAVAVGRRRGSTAKIARSFRSRHRSPEVELRAVTRHIRPASLAVGMLDPAGHVSPNVRPWRYSKYPLINRAILLTCDSMSTRRRFVACRPSAIRKDGYPFGNRSGVPDAPLPGFSIAMMSRTASATSAGSTTSQGGPNRTAQAILKDAPLRFELLSTFASRASRK